MPSHTRSKSILFTLVTVCVSSSFFASSVVAAPWCWGKGVPTKAKPLFSQSTTDALGDSIEQKSGVGKLIGAVPKSYQEIIDSGRDFSAETVTKRAKLAVAYWSKIPSGLQAQNFIKFNFDSGVYAQLTLKADEIWQKMLGCNSGDAEAARKNYFYGTPCVDKSASADIVNQIKELAGNYMQFLETSPVLYPAVDPNYNDLEPYDRFSQYLACVHIASPFTKADRPISGAFSDVCENPPLQVLYGLNGLENHFELRIPNQHPLMVQIELQTLSIALNYFLEKRRSGPLDPTVLKEFPNVYGTSSSYLDPDTTLIQKVMLNASVIAAGIIETSADASANHSTESCSVYGFWPALNRTMMFASPDTFNALPLSIIANVAKSMQLKAAVACGSEFVRDQGFGIYANLKFPHVSEMRRLFGTYWPDGKKAKPFVAMAKTLGIKPNPKICL